MNLDKLKELEAKATPGEWRDLDVGADHGGPYSQILVSGKSLPVGMTGEDEKLICALRNSAKEMISTIERYKAALEAVDKESRNGNQLSLNKRLIAIDEITEEALKDPEKTGGGHG